jgi:hypothetical protein
MTEPKAILQDSSPLLQKDVSQLFAGIYRDLVPRQAPATITYHILSGKITGRETDRLAITGRVGATAVHAVVYHLAGETAPKRVDALDALLVQDRLIKIKKRLLRDGRTTTCVDAGLSFCRGVLAQISLPFPEETQFVKEHLYPFATAPSRIITSTNPRKQRRNTTRQP